MNTNPSYSSPCRCSLRTQIIMWSLSPGKRSHLMVFCVLFLIYEVSSSHLSMVAVY